MIMARSFGAVGSATMALATSVALLRARRLPALGWIGVVLGVLTLLFGIQEGRRRSRQAGRAEPQWAPSVQTAARRQGGVMQSRSGDSTRRPGYRRRNQHRTSWATRAAASQRRHSRRGTHAPRRVRRERGRLSTGSNRSQRSSGHRAVHELGGSKSEAARPPCRSSSSPASPIASGSSRGDGQRTEMLVTVKRWRSQDWASPSPPGWISCRDFSLIGCARSARHRRSSPHPGPPQTGCVRSAPHRRPARTPRR